MKKGFTIIEICVVFFVILAASFLFLPKGIESSKQIRLIAKWAQKYSEVQYMFSVMKTQAEIEGELTNRQFGENIKSHLRLMKPVDKVYKQFFKNKKELLKDSFLGEQNYYFTPTNEIVGFGWINNKCKDKELCAIMTFDLNGLEEPNVFGEDIFVLNMYKDRISPYGENDDSATLRQGCRNLGLTCSYYYLIGGRFE